MIKIQGASELAQHIYYEYDKNSFPLGEGGMGKVYEGYCCREDNPEERLPVAIKHMTTITKELIDRAMREASIQIDHPNLLRMYGFIPNMEFDQYVNGLKPEYYIVMERLVGVSLDALIDGIRIDASGMNIEYAQTLYSKYQTNRDEFVKEVMSSVFQGVKTLHDMGVVHRDIDPSNVMITRDGNIKLIDFGVSKVVSSNVATSKGTQHGSLIGKLDYGAPEIVSGDVEHHSYTTDIYALGIMLYQLYVGELPFQGDSSHVMQAQLTKLVPVEKISNRKMQQVVAKATRKEQSERYQSMNEFIADFERAFTQDPIPQWESESDKESGLQPWHYAAVCVIGLLVGILIRLLL